MSIRIRLFCVDMISGPGMLSPMREKADKTGRETALWPWILAAIVAVAGTILSFSLRQTRARLEEQAIEKRFLAEAQRMRDAIVQEITLSIEVLDSIRQLHAISDQVSAQDFEEFVQRGMIYQRHVLGAFGFVQRMDQLTRQLLDLPQEDSKAPSLRIVEQDKSGAFVSATARAEYYPLTYQTPDGELGVPVGFDFNSVPDYRTAIETMLRTGTPVLAGRAIHEERKAADNAYYFFSPIVYKAIEGLPVEPPGFLIGFTVGLFRPESVLARAQGAIAVQGLEARLLPPAAQTISPKSLAGDALHYEAPVRVADQLWTFRCHAGLDYLSARGTRQRDLLLLVGLLVTALLTVELLLMAGRAQRTERLVRIRTQALHEAKNLLETEMSERARLEGEIIEIGNREKLRVGQDLHDSLGQKLTAAVFLSRALSQKLEPNASAEGDEARKINSLLKEAVAQVRRLARGLAPVELGDQGLEGALRQLADDSEKTYGISCVFRAEGPVQSIQGKTAIHLYHIAQEALNNAARHGKPARVIMTLSLKDGLGQLTVEDDGTGIKDVTAEGRGMGLQIMRHRATMIGGKLEIGNRRGGGTEVVCRFGFSSP